MATPQEQKKLNQELKSTETLSTNITKQLKEGASLSKAMQKSISDMTKTLKTTSGYFKDMSSFASDLGNQFNTIEDQVDKITSKQDSGNKKIDQEVKKRYKINKAMMEQVGHATKNVQQAHATESVTKQYQRYLTVAAETLQTMPDAAASVKDEIREMQDSYRGMSPQQQSMLQNLYDIEAIDKNIVKQIILEKQGRFGNVKSARILADTDKAIRDLAFDTTQAYSDIGTENFKRVETAEALAKIEEEQRMIADNYFGRNKDIGKNLIEQLELKKKALQVVEDQNDRQKMINDRVVEGGKYITEPFTKLQGLLESMPAGGLVSTIIGVEDQMDKFKEATRKNLREAFNDPSPENLNAMVTNIGEEGLKSIKMLTSGFGSLFKMIASNPVIALVAALTAAGSALSAIYDGALETRKELGISFLNAAKLQSTINLTAIQFKLLGVSGEDVSAITDGIRANLGGTTQPSAELVKGFTSLVATTGISGENVTKLATQMMSVGASSQEAAMSQIESVAALARANDVAPGDILNDIASDSDLFASHAKDGGKNLAMAAITAKKLGLEMATVSKISDSLLSFEESINAQMEAQVLTGKNINTDKAREMALSGDLDGMQREITKQIGSAAEFERMNVVQRQALAGAFGVSVGELGKMITNQEKINNLSEGEKKSRDMVAGILKFIGGAMASLMSLAKAMIPAFVGLGIAIAVAFYPVTLTVAGFIALGKAVEFLNSKFDYAGTILGTLVALGTAFALKMKLAGTNVGGGLMKSLGGVKDKLKSAVSGGEGGGAGAVDELGKKGPGVGKGMKSLAKGVGAFANPKVILGLAALTVSLIGVGYALKLAAPGIKAFGEAIGTIIGSVATGISNIIGAIGDFAVKLMTIASPTMALGLFATAAGFTALAGSMAMFAGAGLLALPALLALTAFNAVTGAGGGGEGDNTTDTLLKEQITELKKMNAKLDMVTSNTKKGADEARSLNSSVIMA